MLAVGMARNEGAAAGTFRQTVETVAAPVRQFLENHPPDPRWMACTTRLHRLATQTEEGGYGGRSYVNSARMTEGVPSSPGLPALIRWGS